MLGWYVDVIKRTVARNWSSQLPGGPDCFERPTGYGSGQAFAHVTFGYLLGRLQDCKTTEHMETKIMMRGLTSQGPEHLLQLAKSWCHLQLRRRVGQE